VGAPQWCAGWGGGGREASYATNWGFEANRIGCRDAWLSSALRPGGTGKLQLEHGGAKLEVWRGQSAGRLENEFMLEVNWSTVAAHGRESMAWQQCEERRRGACWRGWCRHEEDRGQTADAHAHEDTVQMRGRGGRVTW
jgi:hypothetical protein